MPSRDEKPVVDIFYFDNDRLIAHSQTSGITHDIGKLRRLFVDLRNTSDSLKENWLQKKEIKKSIIDLVFEPGLVFQSPGSCLTTE